MLESLFSVNMLHSIDIEEDDSDSSNAAAKTINCSHGLKIYTIIEVLASEVEFEREN